MVRRAQLGHVAAPTSLLALAAWQSGYGATQGSATHSGKRQCPARAVPGQLRAGQPCPPGYLLTLAPGAQELPADVARSWDHLGQLGPRPLARAALPDDDLPALARDLLDELEELRRPVLTSPSFAPDRCTYDSLAAESGVGRERVRQLETSALEQLARTAAHDRYRLLRWRAASAARLGGADAAAIPGALPWLDPMLSWLAGQPA